MADSFSADAVMAELQKVSADIKREVGALIAPAADNMAARLVVRYPRGRTTHQGRPHMKDDVHVRALSANDPSVPTRMVIGARIGSIWQDGTGVRRDASRKNANRGRMPAADPHFFERSAVAARTQMLHRAQAILDRNRTF